MFEYGHPIGVVLVGLQRRKDVVGEVVQTDHIVADVSVGAF